MKLINTIYVVVELHGFQAAENVLDIFLVMCFGYQRPTE
jgi:hypothetical protein